MVAEYNSTWDNLKDAKHKINRAFKRKRSKYPKEIVNHLKTKDKNRKSRVSYRGINSFVMVTNINWSNENENGVLVCRFPH